MAPGSKNKEETARDEGDQAGWPKAKGRLCLRTLEEETAARMTDWDFLTT
jgi:hypothetical protein